MKALAEIDFNDVQALLPHTGNMVLLDRILDYQKDSLTAQVTVRDDRLFNDQPELPAWAGIEYMAQTIAAYIGVQALLAGEPIKLGYLLGTRRYVSNIASFNAGTVLYVDIKKIMQDEQLGVFECKIYGEEIEITANLNVYQPPDAIVLANPS